MKTLVFALFFTIIGWVVTDTRVLAQVSEIPQSLKEEMATEQPEYRAAIELAPLLAAAILYFVKADLWVVTKIHMVGPEIWRFRDGDIELISRQVRGKMVILYQKAEKT